MRASPTPALFAVGVTLVVSFPDAYPDGEPPSVAFASTTGLDEPQKKELAGLVTDCLAENLGMPVVYTVAERVREWLSGNNVKPSDGSAFDEMMRRKALEAAGGSSYAGASSALSREADPSLPKRYVTSAEEAEEAATKKRYGTPVTPEAFMAWRTAYETEMDKFARAEEEAGREAPLGWARRVLNKSTGRKLFEEDATLATSDAAADDDGTAADVDYSRRKGAGAKGGAGAGKASGAGAGGAGAATIVFDMSAFEGELPSDEDDDDEEYVPGDSDDDDDDDDDDDEDDEDDD
jgi:hypothetical protein